MSPDTETRPTRSPAEQVVDRQTDAFNRQDLEAFLDCYADGAEVLAEGAPVVSGKEALRELYAHQFAQVPATAVSTGRIAHGDWIADREHVSGPGLPGLDVLALYRVHDGLIDRVEFLGREERG
ncbi:hypothetical protein GCM10010297_37890 [Streptomyces malachitofuscus]|nr:hypothetical protein GCM10010297_37890 [Streptomyces malachitofuscus]